MEHGWGSKMSQEYGKIYDKGFMLAFFIGAGLAMIKKALPIVLLLIVAIVALKFFVGGKRK